MFKAVATYAGAAMLGLCLVAPVQAAVSATDDLGHTITLQKPAQRIVSLSPHVTELLFAAGGGAKIVGTVQYSDYPEAAKAIPRVGDNRQLDIERILSLKPDLLVVWMHGAFERQLEPLAKSGIPYFFSEPRRLEDIPATLEKLGTLLGSTATAQAAAAQFRQQMQQLSLRPHGQRQVRSFYQVWGKPLFTLNDQHIVSDALRLCGGENIFAGLPTIAPNVSVEAVLKEDPEVIISGDSANQGVSGIEQWRGFANLQAVKKHNLVAVDGDLLNRSGPRIIEGARAICRALDAARQK